MPEPLLATRLEAAARRHGSATAVRDERFTLSYTQLLMQASGIAQDLHACGLIADETVLVRVSNHPLDFAAFLGVWLAGGVVVPVHRGSPDGVVEGIQAKAQCKRSIDLDPAGTLRVAAAARAVTAGTGGRSGLRPVLRGAALVIFTSGSTGSPKGAVLTHAAFAGKLDENQKLLNLSQRDVTLLVLNNTFSFGIWLALVTLFQGGTLVVRARFSAGDFPELLAAEGITRVGVVPTMIRAMFATLPDSALSAARTRLQTAGCLRDMVTGGEPLGTDLSARLRAFIAPARLYDIYGLTETATSDFVLTPDAYADHPGSIGRVASRVRYRIVSEQGSEVLPGSAGELQLLTPFIMAGYLGDEALAEAAFDGDWFRTGDLAVADPDGHVSIAGRRKDVMVRGGNKITPLEVERALGSCPGIAAALVVGLPDAVLGQRIHALLIPAPDAVVDAEAVRHALADRLERFKHPDVCYLGTELPVGRTGKVDRGQLQGLLASGALSPMPSWSASAGSPSSTHRSGAAP